MSGPVWQCRLAQGAAVQDLARAESQSRLAHSRWEFRPSWRKDGELEEKSFLTTSHTEISHQQGLPNPSASLEILQREKQKEKACSPVAEILLICLWPFIFSIHSFAIVPVDLMAQCNCNKTQVGETTTV